MESSRKRHACAVPLVLIGLLPGCSSPGAQPAQSSRQPPAAAVNPITVDSTEEQIRQAVATARVGCRRGAWVCAEGAWVREGPLCCDPAGPAAESPLIQ